MIYIEKSFETNYDYCAVVSFDSSMDEVAS